MVNSFISLKYYTKETNAKVYKFMHKIIPKNRNEIIINDIFQLFTYAIFAIIFQICITILYINKE